MNSRLQWLLACGALALGEFVASINPFLSEAWPFFAAAALLFAAFGYGLALRHWRPVFLVLAGAALFLCASVESERFYRDQPWLRNARRHERRSEPSTLAASIRNNLSRRASIGLSHDRETAGLNRAILLGERWRIPPRMKRTFAESGTIHVFAISGLHVMAVAKVITVLLSLLLIPRRFIGLATVPILWAYVWIIGFPPSAVRAALMASFYLSALAFWRRPDPVMSWVLAFLLVHLISPLKTVDIGNALSFSVMLAIVLVAEYFRVEGWRGALLMTCSAWMVGVPIAAHSFGRVSPGGILANLVLIFTAALSVFAGVIGILVSYVSTVLAAHFNNLSALFTGVMVAISEFVARLPGSSVEFLPWTYSQCAEWYAALLLCAWLVHSVQTRRRQL